MPFTSDLVVREIGPDLWKVEADLHYEGNEGRLTVPAGTVTDFASVPKLLRVVHPQVRQVQQGGGAPRLPLR